MTQQVDTQRVQTRRVSQRDVADRVADRQASSQHHRHHRRGPAKRVLLVTGPFLLLAAAFLLSAGVVQIVEQTPVNQIDLTLAQERALAALTPSSGMTHPPIASSRMPQLPKGVLDAGGFGSDLPPTAPVAELDPIPRTARVDLVIVSSHGRGVGPDPLAGRTRHFDLQ